MPRHQFIPSSTSEASTFIDECIRPGLRCAYPLHDDHGEDRRFQRLLDALAQRHTHPSPRAGRTAARVT